VLSGPFARRFSERWDSERWDSERSDIDEALGVPIAELLVVGTK
jgi:hypothetical protein